MSVFGIAEIKEKGIAIIENGSEIGEIKEKWIRMIEKVGIEIAAEGTRPKMFLTFL